VQPRAVPAGHVGDLRQRVDPAGVGGARGGDHHGGAVDPGQRGVQRVRPEPAAEAVDDHRLRHAEQPGGPGHAVVRVRPAHRGGHPAAPGVPGQQQAELVGFGATTGDHRVRAGRGREAQPGELGGDRAFQFAGGRGLVPGVHRRVQRADRQVRGGGHGQRRAVQVRGAPRVRGFHRSGGQRGGQLAQRGLGAVPLGGQHRAELPAQRGDRGRAAGGQRATAFGRAVGEGADHDVRQRGQGRAVVRVVVAGREGPGGGGACEAGSGHEHQVRVFRPR
jgi:hypothetical protein